VNSVADPTDEPLADLRLRGAGRVPSGRYNRAIWAAAERERLWPQVWTIAGHVSRWRSVGDVRLHAVGASSSVVARLPDDAASPNFAAFRNACRHRGARLCDRDVNTSKITCPVHGWSWHLDGSLCAIPDRAGLLDPPPDLDLRRLPCEERFGFVWVAGSSDAPPLDAFLGPVGPLLAATPLSSWAPRSWTTLELDANWKVSADMHNEAYHLDKLHPQLRGIFDPESVVLSAVGRHHRIDFKLVFAGRPSVDVTQLAVFPNAQFTVHPDHATVLWHRPRGTCVGHSLFDEMTLVPIGSLPAGPALASVDHRQVRAAEAELGEMAAADVQAVQRLAAGLVDASDELLLHRLEGAIWHMHAGIDELLFDAPNPTPLQVVDAS
jgi:phenylpropionate dioxygenase-like ring-hydroxylating dioxygenase large terminal subunit